LGEISQDDEWDSINYRILMEAMQGLTLGGSKKEHIFIREYIDCVQELAGTWKAFQKEYFDDDGTKYNKTVFGRKPGKYSIRAADGGDPVSDYINKFGLQTIFQKGVYLKLVRTVLRRSDSNLNRYRMNEIHGGSNANDWDYSIDESQGTALIQINVLYFNDGKNDLVFGFQQQGKSVKINCAATPYDPSKKSWIEPYESIFKEYAKNHPPFKVNHGKTKAYVSMGTSDFNMVDKTFPEMAREFYKKFKEARGIIAELDRVRLEWHNG
jgi:hypothetical protein